MKIIKSLFCLLVLVSFLTSCTKTKTEYFEDGSLQSVVQYRLGKETGTCKYYFINPPHPLKMTVEMKNGKREGSLVKYYINGKLELRCMYHDDLEEGVEERCSIFGGKISDITYLHGKKHGKYVYYHDNGEIQEEGSFYEDLFDGHWAYYDERGVLVGEGDYDKGTGVQKGYSPQGNLVRLIHYQNNMKNGEDIVFNDNGDTLKVTVFKDDRIVSDSDEQIDE